MKDTQDGWGGMPSGWGQRGSFGKDTSLAAHDRIYHPNGYKPGDKCKFREQLAKGDGSDTIPSANGYLPLGWGKSVWGGGLVSARHGMFDDDQPKYTPQELDQMAVKSVCKRLGVEFPGKGKIKSGRWMSASDPKLEYTVVDTDTGMFASGRGNRDYMVLARPEEAMSFSDPDDAAAVAKATGPHAKVLDRKGFEAFVASKVQNPITFPKTLTEGDLEGFRVTLNGSTEPFVGKIGKSLFIAKKGSHTSADHVRNEDLANRFHLAAGLRAPRSKVYEVADAKDERTAAQRYMDEVNGKKGPFKETVMLAEYIPNAVSLEAAWNDAKKAKDAGKLAKIQSEVLKAYPIEAFVAGIDIFQNDNALVDGDGNLWMVDNGAAFDYRARGGRKGWFNERTDPADPKTGYLSLAKHNSQKLLADVLKGVPDEDIIKAAADYDFEKLAKKLPWEYQTPGLMQYAKAMNEYSGRTAKK